VVGKVGTNKVHNYVDQNLLKTALSSLYLYCFRCDSGSSASSSSHQCTGRQ